MNRHQKKVSKFSKRLSRLTGASYTSSKKMVDEMLKENTYQETEAQLDAIESVMPSLQKMAQGIGHALRNLPSVSEFAEKILDEESGGASWKRNM